MQTRNLLKSAGVLSLLLIFAAVPAHANAGTPLMWFTSFHLLLGNAIIGVIEGRILARWWKLPKISECGWMIAANYVSAFCGVFVLGYYLEVHNIFADHGNIPFSRIPEALILIVISLYILTVVIEWPFVHFSVKKAGASFDRLWLKTLSSSALVNIISYTGLIILYLLNGNISLLTKTTYDASASFLEGRPGHIYYFDQSKDAVCKMTLTGKQEPFSVHTTFNGDTMWHYIFARPNKTTLLWDLCVMDKEWDTSTVLVKSFSKAATDVFNGYDGIKHQNSTNRNSWYAMDFRKHSDMKYTVRVGFWDAEGLTVTDKKSNRSTTYALESSILRATCRRATVLPGDIVIWDLGGRIMAMDLNNKHITQLAHGRSPVVTLD